MFDFNVILSLFKGYADALSSEDITIEVLTEDLSCLIIYFILRIDHDAVLGAGFVEYFADDFWVAGVNEDQARHEIFFVL